MPPWDKKPPGMDMFAEMAWKKKQKAAKAAAGVTGAVVVDEAGDNGGAGGGDLMSQLKARQAGTPTAPVPGKVATLPPTLPISSGRVPKAQTTDTFAALFPGGSKRNSKDEQEEDEDAWSNSEQDSDSDDGLLFGGGCARSSATVASGKPTIIFGEDEDGDDDDVDDLLASMGAQTGSKLRLKAAPTPAPVAVSALFDDSDEDDEWLGSKDTEEVNVQATKGAKEADAKGKLALPNLAFGSESDDDDWLDG